MVKVDGDVVSREHQLLGVYVSKSVNKIATARLLYLDGAAASDGFPLSNAATFVPGGEIEILAGSTNDPVALFQGLVVRQSLKIRDNGSPQLVVECRHKAAKLTVGVKNAYFFDQTDGDVISLLLDNAELDSEVDATTVTHKQLVQYDCTDWDFVVSRAEANGMLVFSNDDALAIKTPEVDGNSVASLQFGSTVLEMDAEVDARIQHNAVKSFAWDPAQQSVLEIDAADPGISGLGNFSSDDLASVASPDQFVLTHCAAGEEEAQAWADAQSLKSQMSKVNGRVKCEGIGTVNPGDIVSLSGVGERFGGDVFVSGIRHEFDLVQGWKTHIQFGNTDRWFSRETQISAPKAGGLLPGVNGLQIGIVVSNEDPDGEHRVRVRMPLVDNQDEGTWARIAALDAGDERGFFVRPEVDDEVILGFINDDPRHAVILGMLHSSAKPAPLEGTDDNHEKVYQTRSGMRLYFDDENKVMQLSTPDGNEITLSEQDQSIKIADQNDNVIEMTSDGIKIESGKAIELKSGTELKMESGTSFEGKGGTELKLEGSAGAEFTSSAITKVKGSLLQLN